jgi:hypothetical protein
VEAVQDVVLEEQDQMVEDRVTVTTLELKEQMLCQIQVLAVAVAEAILVVQESARLLIT